jgi:hypothetical protein
MKRYVFFSAHSRDAKELTAAKKTARSLGATVLGAVAGSMLVEAALAKAEKVARALPGWRYTAERKSVRVPERTPLQRARLASAKS